MPNICEEGIQLRESLTLAKSKFKEDETRGAESKVGTGERTTL